MKRQLDRLMKFMHFKDKDEKILQTQRAVQLQRKAYLFENQTTFVKEWKIENRGETSTHIKGKESDTVDHVPTTSW